MPLYYFIGGGADGITLRGEHHLPRRAGRCLILLTFPGRERALLEQPTSPGTDARE